MNSRARIAHLYVHASGCVASVEVQANDEIQQGAVAVPDRSVESDDGSERSLLLDGHLPRRHVRPRSILCDRDECDVHIDISN